MKKKTILILYEFFYPGYKAGGPVQSLVNMVMALGNDFDFKIATTAYDLHVENPYPNLVLDKWSDKRLNEETNVSVWYSSKIKPSLVEFYAVIQSAKPDLIYINGFYTNHFLYPLLLKKMRLVKGIEFVVSPRGMLQAGALQNKTFQKKSYLQFLKLFGLMNDIRFHATSNDEVKDIETFFGNHSSIIVAGNIPKAPITKINYADKKKGKLKLIYLSLISEKKNLLLLLENLQIYAEAVTLDIYGPIKDEIYWQLCLDSLKKMPANITIEYKADIQPNKVQSLLQQYDAEILLTKGENFGHALFESLSVGRPIITSHFTPWNELENKQAGWNVDISSNESIQQLLSSLVKKDTDEWNKFCEGALQLANEYYHDQSFADSYKKLFN